MRVLHIIPAAFHYYDDIQEEAFGLIDEESKLGIDAMAYTIEYQLQVKSEPVEKVKKKKEPLAPPPAIFKRRASSQYKGRITHQEIEADLETFDIIHVHVPLFGAIGKILEWKKKFPKLKIVVSVHRASKKTDFFTVVFALYNRLLLPKLFKEARIITAPSTHLLFVSYKKIIEPFLERVVPVDRDPLFLDLNLAITVENWEELGMKEILALKCSMLYTSLTS